MLETIREYATEQFVALANKDALHRRMRTTTSPSPSRRIFATSTPVGSSGWIHDPGAREPPGGSRIGEQRGSELAILLAVELEQFWAVRSPEEGVHWLTELLERAADVPIELRAHALRTLGSTANPAGEDALAERAYEDSLELFRELGNERQIATLQLRLGYSALYRGDLEEARRLADASLEGHRTNGNTRGESQALTLAGEILYAEGNPEQGLELVARGAELAEESGFSWWRARTLRSMVDGTLGSADSRTLSAGSPSRSSTAEGSETHAARCSPSHASHALRPR